MAKKLPNVAVGAPHAKAHNDERRSINLQGVAASYNPNPRYTGPNSADNPAVTLANALDPAFNVSYSSTGTLPSVMECFGDMSVTSNNWSAKTSVAGVASVATYRTMTDADEVLIGTYAGFEHDLYIDGQPFNANPLIPTVSAGYNPFGFVKLVFPSAKTRLLEFRTLAGFFYLAAKAPYRFWKPAFDPNPRVAVVGDSYVYPSTLSDTVAGNAAGDTWIKGAYQRMPALLGITGMSSDGIGGTGYINGGGSQRPYSHADRLAWLGRLKPDVIVMHGGGVNDLFGGNPVPDIITAATNHFRNLRDAHPGAKLVFVEGFTPPGFTPATYVPNLKAISQGVRDNLNNEGIDAYFLDVVTTDPAIKGAGYVTAPSGSGNSNIYVGSDTYHLTVRGHTYVRNLIANKLRTVLADTGDRVGMLV